MQGIVEHVPMSHAGPTMIHPAIPHSHSHSNHHNHTRRSAPSNHHTTHSHSNNLHRNYHSSFEFQTNITSKSKSKSKSISKSRSKSRGKSQSPSQRQDKNNTGSQIQPQTQKQIQTQNINVPSESNFPKPKLSNDPRSRNSSPNPTPHRSQSVQAQAQQSTNHARTMSYQPNPSSKNTRRRSLRKKRPSTKDHLPDTPISIFPYHWDTEKEQFKSREQFHKRGKTMPVTLKKPEAIDHLLSPTRCSKRFMSAYFLNLHQLTTTIKLLDCIIVKCTPIVRQLRIIEKQSKSNHPTTNSNNIDNKIVAVITQDTNNGIILKKTENNRRRSSLDLSIENENENEEGKINNNDGNLIVQPETTQEHVHILVPLQQSTTSRSQTPTHSPSQTSQSSPISHKLTQDIAIAIEALSKPNSPKSDNNTNENTNENINNNDPSQILQTVKENGTLKITNNKINHNIPKNNESNDLIHSRQESIQSTNSIESIPSIDSQVLFGDSTQTLSDDSQNNENTINNHNNITNNNTNNTHNHNNNNEIIVSKSQPETMILCGSDDNKNSIFPQTNNNGNNHTKLSDFKVETQSLPDYAMDELWQSDNSQAKLPKSIKYQNNIYSSNGARSASQSIESAASLSMSASITMGSQFAIGLINNDSTKSRESYHKFLSPTNSNDINTNANSDKNSRQRAATTDVLDASNSTISPTSEDNSNTPATATAINGTMRSQSVTSPETNPLNSKNKSKPRKHSAANLELKRAYSNAVLKHNIELLYHWIDYYPIDFAEPSLLERLLEFIRRVKDRITNKSIQRRWSKLMQLIEHRRSQMRFSSVLDSSISNLRVSPKIRKHDRKTSFQFTDSFFPPREMVKQLGGGADLLNDLHPIVVAEQLTLIDTEIYLQIKLRELTNCAWQKRPDFNASQLLADVDAESMNNDTTNNNTNNTNNNENGETGENGENKYSEDSVSKSAYQALQEARIEAPNLLYMIDHVNRLSLWVATEILSRQNASEMADMIRYFYLVAKRCFEINNIHTCTAVFGGITLEPVRRLRRLSRMVQDDQQISAYHALISGIISCDRNYSQYRTIVEKWFASDMIHGCIPFMPVLVKDLFQIQLRLTPRNDNGEKVVDLNFLEKNCRHIRRVYETQQRARLYCNQFPINTDVQSLLRMNIATFKDEKTLRELSLNIQPKLTKADKENLEMIDTLEEFGFL